jgi:putative ABC transport system permease protein
MALQHLRYAIRRLLREPILALAATATLALCIGANTTVFSLVNSILLRPLPYPDSERICWVTEAIGRNRSTEIVMAGDYYSMSDSSMSKESRIFESVSAFQTSTLNWSGSDRPEQVDSAQVTPSFFRVMGTPPMLGRTLARDEEGSHAPAVVVVSYSFWRRALSADPQAVGRKVILDRAPHTIIGVMPQGYDYPKNTDIWQPLLLDESTQRPRSVMRPLWVLNVVARLSPGVTRTQMDAEMLRLTQQIHAEYPPEFDARGFTKGMAIKSVPLHERISGDLRKPLLVLSGAVGLVLLIACVNLANLLLARASARRREIAVRLALGSNRGRVVWQMLSESIVLALPGGLAGMAIAAVAVRALNIVKPMVLDRYPAISLDVAALAFTFSLTLFTGMIFGMAPAFEAARIDIQDTLKSAGQHSGGPGATLLRRVLVVAELSISLILLIGAGLLARSFLKMTHLELDFAPEHLLSLRVSLVGPGYAASESQVRFYRDALDRVRQLPMVKSAAVSTDLPLSGERQWRSFQYQIDGRPRVPIAERPTTQSSIVDPDFFVTMGVPLKRGRWFDATDRPGSPQVVVVNEAFARAAFHGQEAVGQRILERVNPADDQNAIAIVGVVGSVRGPTLGAEPPPIVYECVCQSTSRDLTGMRIVVRTQGEAYAAVRPVSEAFYSVDREQPVFDVKSMEDRVAESLAPERFQLLLIGTFTFLALGLAAAGVYGVMSYLVARRNREIAIRMALGARPGDVMQMVFRESMVLVPVAVIAGLAGAWALTRFVRTMLYGIAALDAPTFLIAPLILAAVVVAASLGPARRAATVDPMTALREE